MLSIRIEVLFVIEVLALTVSNGGDTDSGMGGDSETVERQAVSSNPSNNLGSNPAATRELSFVPYSVTDGLKGNMALVETQELFNLLIAD